MKEHLKNFALLTGSTLIMAVGIYFFKFANNFTFGGITGFAVLVAKFTPLSASDFSFIANMLLLIIGLFVLGKKFAAQTAYSSILLSVTLSGLERIYPMSHPLTNEPLLELIFAIVLPAIGSAILFNIGASSGGTDVIAMILKKYTSVDIGKGISGISCNIIGEWTEILAYPGKQKYFGGRCNGILSVYDVTFNPGSVGH